MRPTGSPDTAGEFFPPAAPDEKKGSGDAAGNCGRGQLSAEGVALTDTTVHKKYKFGQRPTSGVLKQGNQKRNNVSKYKTRYTVHQVRWGLQPGQPPDFLVPGRRHNLGGEQVQGVNSKSNRT